MRSLPPKADTPLKSASAKSQATKKPCATSSAARTADLERDREIMRYEDEWNPNLNDSWW